MQRSHPRGSVRPVIFVLALLWFSTAANAGLRYHVPDEDTADRLYRVIHEGGQQTVYASGEITSGDAEGLRSFLQAWEITDAKIAFDSPGGSLTEALELGQLIRSLGLDTEVRGADSQSALCASACAYAFAGGINRYYQDSAGRLGVHQFYSESADALKQGDVQLMSGLLVAYLTEMGVDANAFAVSTLADADEMVWLSAIEAEALGFANNGAQPTTAEIKTIDMQPYLRLDQVRDRGHARVLIICGTSGLSMMAGVVANEEDVAFHSAISKRSYIELDGKESLVSGPGGAEPEGDVLWLDRSLDAITIVRLLKADKLDIWTEGGGAVRWGGGLDLRPVRSSLQAYVSDCASSKR